MRQSYSSPLKALAVIAGASTLLLSCSNSDTSPQPTTGGPDDTLVQAISSSDRYIVAFTPGAAAAGRAAVAAQGSIVLDITGRDAVAARLPDAAIAGLQNNPNIRLVEKDPLRKPTATPSEGTVPYGIDMVQATALDHSLAGNRTVCIIDSGYDMGHESLPGTTSVSGNDDPVSGSWNVDGCGHGTHVAGTITGLGTNVVGVNPDGNLNLHIEKVFSDTCGWAYASDLISAAYKCKNAGANVISMSLGCASGGPWCYSSEEDAGFQDLYDTFGVLNVAAASNDGKGWYSYPASYDSVVSVAAIDANKQHAYFSNTNDAVELAAPGVSILSTVPLGCEICDNSTNLYEYWNGTSMATPHVAGVAALVWSYDSTLTNAEVRSALQRSAEDLGSAGRDNETGYGLVQAQAAVELLDLASSEPECTTDSDCATDEYCTAEGTCAALCGNGTCDGTESYDTCPTDCDECADDTDCAIDQYCSTENSCEDLCGNGACEGDESYESCPTDCDQCVDDTDCATDQYCSAEKTCEPLCGDGTCGGDESYGTCPADCDECVDDNGCLDDQYCSTENTCEPLCGNGTCDDGETAETCSDDCAVSTCEPVGDFCASDADCCSGKCRGKPGGKSCK